jgi:hypothetical protein
VQEGSVVALPFGDALLLVTQRSASAPTRVERLAGDRILWSLDLPATASPANLRRDPFSGDAVGFEDLTGDGVPDLATQVDGARLDVFDGRTGDIVWTMPLPPGSAARPIASARGPADLLLVGAAPGAIALTRLDGATGDALWSAHGGAPPAVSAQDVGVSDDGASDLLVTVPAGDGAGVYVLDGGTGGPAWSRATDDDAPAPAPLESTGRLASVPARAEPLALPAVSGALVATLAAAGLAAVLVARRRRARESADG